MYERELDVAEAAVREAARLCVEVLRTSDLKTLSKGDRSPVTVADFGSQALVCRRLERAFPEDKVIAEESSSALREPGADVTRQRVVALVTDAVPGADEASICRWIDRGGHVDHADRYWTLDPIDGTKGFLRGDQYAVALALVIDGRPTVACLACPNLAGPDGGTGVLVSAIRGQGVTQAPLFDAEAAPRPIRVSGTARAHEARFCESFEAGHSSHDDASTIAALLGISEPPVRMDSQAKYAAVARGEADIYLRLPRDHVYVEKIWDHAAGCLVVEEAGGRVSDVRGRPLEFMHGRRLESNRGVLVTNGLLHEVLLDALKHLEVA